MVPALTELVLFLTNTRQSLPNVHQVGANRNVVEPRLQSAVEKFLPFISNVKYQRLTDKKMLEPETRSNATKVKKVPGQII